MTRTGRTAAVIGVVLLTAAVAAVGWLVVDALNGDGEASPEPTEPGPADPPASQALVPTTVDPASLVELEQVWLLDRGDGSFDWGLIVEGVSDGDRRDVEVTVRLRDDDGDVVFTEETTIARLAAGQRAPVGGTVPETLDPVRIETDVSVGFPAVDDGTPVASLDVRAVERRVDPTSVGGFGEGSEVVIGRLRATSAVDVDDVRLAAIWTDPLDGGVVAAVFRDVERVRPGVDARFELALDAPNIPDGPPTAVLWSR